MKIFGFYITRIDWLKRHNELSVEFIQLKILFETQTKAILTLKKVLEERGFNFDDPKEVL